MTGIEKLANFILDHNNDGAAVDLGLIENWFRMIRQTVLTVNSDPVTPETAFKELTAGMAARYYKDGITTPKLLGAIREYCAEYIRANSEIQEGETRPAPDHLFSVFPDKAILPNNEFERQLINGAINTGEKNIIFSKKGKPGEVNAQITITRPATVEGLIINGKYNQYDAEISRGIDDIFVEGHESHIFTLPQLYRVITHNPDAKPSAAELKTIEKSIEAQRTTRAKGNTERVKTDAEKRGYKDNFTNEIDDMLLDLRGLYIEAGGKRIRAYFIKERPLPSLFGALTKQEIRIPAEVYYIRKIDTTNTPTTAIANSPDRIAIKGYFVERIAAMKQDLSLAKEKQRQYNARRKRKPEIPERSLSTFQGLKSHVILYSSAFEAAGIANKDAKTLSRHKKYINDCLEYWTATGFIKSFRERYGKRKDSPDSVEIFLD